MFDHDDINEPLWIVDFSDKSCTMSLSTFSSMACCCSRAKFFLFYQLHNIRVGVQPIDNDSRWCTWHVEYWPGKDICIWSQKSYQTILKVKSQQCSDLNGYARIITKGDGNSYLVGSPHASLSSSPWSNPLSGKAFSSFFFFIITNKIASSKHLICSNLSNPILSCESYQKMICKDNYL